MDEDGNVATIASVNTQYKKLMEAVKSGEIKDGKLENIGLYVMKNSPSYSNFDFESIMKTKRDRKSIIDMADDAMNTGDWGEYDARCDEIAKENGFYGKLRGRENMCRAFNKMLREHLESSSHVVRYMNVKELAAWKETGKFGPSSTGVSGEGAEYKCVSACGFTKRGNHIEASIKLTDEMRGRVSPVAYTAYPRLGMSGTATDSKMDGSFMWENEARLDKDAPVDWENITITVRYAGGLTEEQFRSEMPYVKNLKFGGSA